MLCLSVIIESNGGLDRSRFTGITLVSTNQRQPGPVDVVVAPAGDGAAVERSFTDSLKVDDGMLNEAFKFVPSSIQPNGHFIHPVVRLFYYYIYEKKNEASLNSDGLGWRGINGCLKK
jgi:hypothetical protein